MWMGIADNEQRDSSEFGQKHEIVRDLVRKGFEYRGMTDQEREVVREKMRALVLSSRMNCPNPGEMVAYGWKRPVTIFTCEIFLDAFPEARTIHLIRDGRDVMLSRLDYRMNRLHLPLNRLAVFGTRNVDSYRGESLSLETVAAHRNEIEMEHWVTAVRFGMRGREYPDRYLEIRYEDLCTYPEQTMTRVFQFLDIPFRSESRDWVVANASTRSIGKWKGREGDLTDAIAVGAPLLKELGYI